MSSASSASAVPDPEPERLIWDKFWGSPDRISGWRNTPSLVWEALRLVWRVDPRLTVYIMSIQVLVGGGIGVQLLVGREVLRELLTLSQAGGGIGSIVPELAILVIITLLLEVLRSLLGNYQAALGEYVGIHIHDRIIEVSSEVELSFYEKPAFVDELLRARTTGTYRTLEIVNSFQSLVMSLVTSVGIAVALFSMHPLLPPLVVLAGIPLLIATLINSRQTYVFDYLWTPRSRQRMYLGELLTVPESAKEVRVFAAGRFLKQRYDELTKERLRRFREYLRARLHVSVAGRLGGSLGAAVAMGALIWLVMSARIDFATAMAAAAATQLLAGRLSALARGVGRLVESGMFFEDYRSFLSYAKMIESSGRVVASPAGPFERLSVEDISFRYPETDPLVLKDVSLEIEAGEVVALVGENGSGKTTLVKLILQLYEPDEGRILWNGVDAREIEHETLRSELTVIFQDFIKYHLPVADNIALGRAERAMDQTSVRDAAVKAGADQFVRQLPQGYDTRLGRQFSGGHELSIGQWQRLALARAVFRGGSLLILDEPTASLDPRAEHELFAQIREFGRERSVLLISHRFSSVRSADRIYVLEDGRITEQGTHDLLMARDGHYAELFRLQAAAYLGEDARKGGP